MIWKWPTGMVQKDGHVLHTQRTGCDFFGYNSDGRVVMIECKISKPDRLKLDERNGLRPHQFDTLKNCARAGGIAIVVWQHKNEIASMPVMFVADVMEREGRRSIVWSDVIAPFRHHKTDDPVSWLEKHLT